MRRGRRPAWGIVLAAVGALLAACQVAEPPPKPAEKPVETVDVTTAPDARATTSTDTVERRSAEPGGFSGVLPEGFPTAVPILRPSSLVEVEPGAGGSMAVTLATTAAPAEADRAYRTLLSGAGWSKTAGGPGAAGSWRKGELRLDVQVRETHPGCRLRLAVGPGGA